jgi:low temperature requirement protein LtrA
MVLVLRGPPRRNFERILVWRSAVGAFALAGGLAHGAPRAVLWVLAVLTSPLSSVSAESAWKILGGPALFLAGHAAFKFVLWQRIPWTRVIGVAAIALLTLAAAALPQIALAACAVGVGAAGAGADHFPGARFSPRTR